MARKMIVEIVGDSRSVERAFKRTEKAGKQFSATFAGATRGLTGFSGAQIGVAAAATGLALGVRKSINAASDLNESINAVSVVFGQATDKITDFSQTAAEQVGLSARAFNQLVTPLGAALQNFGLSADEAADKSIELTKRAADMASVFNTDVTQALEAMQAALRGEADPIERFGVSVNEAAVNAEALQLGLAKTTTEITAQDKAAARLSLIMKQTAKFQGDFANTSGSAANQQRILRARLDDAAASIGNKMLPAVVKLTEAMNDLITAAEKAGDFFDRLGQGKVLDFDADVTAAQLQKVRDELAKVAGEGDLQVKALDEAIQHMNSSLLHTLDALESLRGQRFAPKVVDDTKDTDKKVKATQFQLPGPLRLAQAQARLTESIKDDVAVARRIKQFIEDRIKSSKLTGERLISALAELAAAQDVISSAVRDEADKRKAASEKEADARRKSADAQKRAAERFAEQIDKARTTIGQLFQGPVLAPDDAQRRAALGLTAGPDPRELLADIRSQNVAAKTFRDTLTRLTRSGAPAGFVQELLAGGLSAQATAIAAAPKALQRAIFEAFKQRERLARQMAERPIRIFLNVKLDGKTVATSVTTHQQKKARNQPFQRRGPGAGTRLALQ